MRILRAALVVVPAVALLGGVAGVADAGEKRQASGKFESRNWNFEPMGAYAYPDEVGLNDEPGIVVAISNSSFDTDFYDAYWDRGHAIETYQKGDETLVAYLQFGRNGGYKGMTYYFGSGDGCGFCYDGSVQSTVKVEKGRIQGQARLVGKPGELAFDVAFDVPVASASRGELLPAGGGDPGRVYAAYHAAIVAWDKVATRPFYSDKVQADFGEHADEILQAFRKDHPDQGMKIVRGFASGDRALLLVEGETSYSKVKTEVHLRKEKGTWRIVEEMLQVNLGG